MQTQQSIVEKPWDVVLLCWSVGWRQKRLEKAPASKMRRHTYHVLEMCCQACMQVIKR